jgi:predicted DNA binding protein
MTLSEVVLRETHDEFLLNMTRRFSSLRIFIWCNQENDVVEVNARNAEDYSIAMEEIRQNWYSEILEESSDNHLCYLSVHRCSCMSEDTMVRHIGTLDLLHVFPSVLEKGWAHHRIIAFNHIDLNKLFLRLEKAGWRFDVLRKTTLSGFIATGSTLQADVLFSHLTEKQIDALLTAYNHGYYLLPRKAHVKEIASRSHVPTTTFHEHLKKAENKIVSALIPYVHLFKQASSEKRKGLKLK